MQPKLPAIMPLCLTTLSPVHAQTDTPSKTTGRYALVNGLKMYYEIHGTGQPLVMIHGGGARYLASPTWPIPSQPVERRDGIPHYNKSRAVDAPFIATLSQDGHWVVASFTRNTGNVWSNPELTCQHVDPQVALSPGEEAILETKILVVRGSLDDVFKMAMQQRESLKVEVRRWSLREK